MLADAIEAIYQIVTVDSRLKDDNPGHIKVNYFSRTSEEEPTCFPAVTFLVDPVVKCTAISLGKRKEIIFPVKVLCMVGHYSSVWDAQVKLDTLSKAILNIIEENSTLGGKMGNADVRQIEYGYVLDNAGNPYLKVCAMTVDVTEYMAINACN